MNLNTTTATYLHSATHFLSLYWWGLFLNIPGLNQESGNFSETWVPSAHLHFKEQCLEKQMFLKDIIAEREPD